MRTSSVGIADHGLLFEGAIICASYSKYWTIIRWGLLFGGWPNIGELLKMLSRFDLNLSRYDLNS